MTKEEVQSRIDNMFADMLDLTKAVLLAGHKEPVNLIVSAVLTALIKATCKTKGEALVLVQSIEMIIAKECCRIDKLI